MGDTPSNSTFDRDLYAMLLTIAEAGIEKAARGFSGMVGMNLSVSEPGVCVVPLTTVQDILGGPENEAVGIYLRSEGDLAGQFMMIIPVDRALALVDMLMGDPPGANQNLGRQERSALAELGNVTGSYFLNAVAAATGLESRPSPPAVVVDMVGAILNILLMSWDGLSDQVLMIQTKFLMGERQTQADFWVIPDAATLEAIRTRAAVAIKPAGSYD
jgi:chemotaxis protein CheC